ncbi:MAG: hypothetical protein K8F25_19675, partial [Fimbriimonadaceae bacterium]|nr:hypothetical protein [Alphaproteobacteria bacterium]
MLESELIQYGVFGVLAISVGVIAYVLIYPLVSGERKVDKRLKTVAQRSRTSKSRTKMAETQNRRRQVQDTLKELEEAQKKKKRRLTTRALLEQAGLTMSLRTFYI